MHQSNHFSSTFGFLMAATGFAVGLGNIWRFPYITGENGGGAFVIIYLGCALFIGMPILVAELLLGRMGKGNPPLAMANIAREQSRTPLWSHAGHLNLLTAFVIQGTYCVVAGWVLWYLFKAITTGFTDMTTEVAASQFNEVQDSINGMLVWSAVGLLFTSAIIYAGVNHGIERSVRVLMPTLFLLMVTLVIFNATQAGFTDALAYLFTPDFSRVDGGTFLAAVGQAFFSIGVGMAGMLIFGSYLPEKVSITRCVLIIIVIDTCVAMFAGLMIFPMVFRFGMDPASGPGLIFQTLPVAFAQMPGGQFVAILFFTLLSVAAITSMVGMMEPLVAWLEDTFGLPRHRATVTIFIAVGCLGILSILSYNVILGWAIGSMNLSGILEYLANHIMLPVSGLLITLFTAWQISKSRLRSELPLMPTAVFEVWHLLLRFLLPVAIIVILITGLS